VPGAPRAGRVPSGGRRSPCAEGAPWRRGLCGFDCHAGRRGPRSGGGSHARGGGGRGFGCGWRPWEAGWGGGQAWRAAGIVNWSVTVSGTGGRGTAGPKIVLGGGEANIPTHKQNHPKIRQIPDTPTPSTKPPSQPKSINSHHHPPTPPSKNTTKQTTTNQIKPTPQLQPIHQPPYNLNHTKPPTNPNPTKNKYKNPTSTKQKIHKPKPTT